MISGYKNFYKQVLDYQDEYKYFIQAKDKADKNSFHQIWNERYTESFMSDQKVNANEVPQFEFRPSALSYVLKSSAWNILYLTGWFILLFVAAIMAFVKYDVR